MLVGRDRLAVHGERRIGVADAEIAENLIEGAVLLNEVDHVLDLAAGPRAQAGVVTTVIVIRTMEVLLGLPPMNNNDARAAVIATLFSGPGDQRPFTADYYSRDTGLLYEVNPPKAQGSAASVKMDFSRADAVDSWLLNRILWREVKGDLPMPSARHTVIRQYPRSRGR